MIMNGDRKDLFRPFLIDDILVKGHLDFRGLGMVDFFRLRLPLFLLGNDLSA